MKTKLSIISLSALAFMASPVLSAASPMTMGGTVAPTCTFTFTGSGSSTLDLATNTATSETFDVVCNTPSDVSYESANGYLKLTTTNAANDSVSEADLSSAASPNFDAGIDYVVDIQGFNPISTAALPAGTDTVVNAGAAAANATGLTMNFTPVPGKQLLAGAYADVFIVTLTPNAI